MRVLLDGDFTEADLKKIADCLREIEQQDTSKHYWLTFDTDGTKVNLVDVYPKLEGVDVDIFKIPFPKKDVKTN